MGQQSDILNPVQLSLIIPSYNNASELMRELPGLLAYLSDQGITPEVIIVNDGSSEVDALENFCLRGGYRLLRHDSNLGKGAAVRTGMIAATKEIRVFTDADIPFQYDIFPEILQAFETTSVDVVAGDRRQSGYFAKTPLVRRLGSWVFSMMVNVIMMRNLGDTQCGIKAFRDEAAKQIFPVSRLNGFAADIEWLYLAMRMGLKVKWVKAEFRNAGESSVVFWKQALRMLVDVIRLRLS